MARTVFERRNNETYVAVNLAGRRRTKQFPSADENAEFALDLVRWIQSGRDAFAHPGWTMHPYSTLDPVVESPRAPQRQLGPRPQVTLH
jgi:hypothetical protein